MILIVDGKKIKFQNDVKVIFEDAEEGVLQTTITHEGLILDIYDEAGEELLKTAAYEVVDLLEMCH